MSAVRCAVSSRQDFADFRNLSIVLPSAHGASPIEPDEFVRLDFLLLEPTQQASAEDRQIENDRQRSRPGLAVLRRHAGGSAGFRTGGGVDWLSRALTVTA